MDHNTTDTIPELSIDELEAIALVDLLGADDAARIRAAARRMQRMTAAERLAISATEFSLLSVLAAQPERLFSRTELCRAVWDSTNTGSRSRTLDSHLCRLRTKLGGRQWIANRWGQGYSLLPASPALTEVGGENG